MLGKDKRFIRRNPIRVLKSRVGNKLTKLSYLRVKENENWAQRKKETFISYFINQIRRQSSWNTMGWIEGKFSRASV